jgi:hypothetical protein
VVQFSRNSPKSIVETLGPATGNQKAPGGIHSATIWPPGKPGKAGYVIANKRKSLWSAPRSRLAANLQ